MRSQIKNIKKKPLELGHLPLSVEFLPSPNNRAGAEAGELSPRLLKCYAADKVHASLLRERSVNARLFLESSSKCNCHGSQEFSVNMHCCSLVEGEQLLKTNMMVESLLAALFSFMVYQRNVSTF